MVEGDSAALSMATFLQLERTARHAESLPSLRFTMVNETRRMVRYRQAALLLGRSTALRLEAVSSVTVLDRGAPFVRWLEGLARALCREAGFDVLRGVDPSQVPDRWRPDWHQWMAAHVIWCPLRAPGGRQVGVLLLTRDDPWQAAETTLLDQLADAYAHALVALTGLGRTRRPMVGSVLWLAAAAALIGVLAVPVTRTALAPAEIVAREPFTVAAPMDGVIHSFQVTPNEPVTAGQVLLRLDDTDLRSRYEVADRALGIAKAELRAATQGAFADRHRSAQVESLRARVALRQAERDFARRRLERVTVTAPEAGIVIFTDAQDWVGRPVVTGERILRIADPNQVRVRAYLPVSDAIPFESGAAVTVFLDVDPLHPLPAALEHASYEAEVTPSGVLSYRVSAALTGGGVPPRIGLKGTARIAGGRVPLYLFLFRRPLSALRQGLGV